MINCSFKALENLPFLKAESTGKNPSEISGSINSGNVNNGALSISSFSARTWSQLKPRLLNYKQWKNGFNVALQLILLLQISFKDDAVDAVSSRSSDATSRDQDPSRHFDIDLLTDGNCFRFAGYMERYQAEEELQDRGNSTYLVRHRSKECTEYALSIK